MKLFVPFIVEAGTALKALTLDLFHESDFTIRNESHFSVFLSHLIVETELHRSSDID